MHRKSDRTRRGHLQHSPVYPAYVVAKQQHAAFLRDILDAIDVDRIADPKKRHDKQTRKKFIPHVIEPSFGVERLLMAVLSNAYREVETDGKTRIFLALPENLAPTKIIVAPLLKNKEALVEKAREIYLELRQKYKNVEFDLSGKVGKVYAKADEIGVPKVIVIDFDTIEGDGSVSVRNRDDASQIRVKSSEI